ncbi:DUF4114 domain-containing protein [Christiangramia sp. LLG6405-1]|uniref:DUF4114 domain-containing protein n=1 Tax=Christiangramia sp. LLG6405-1 TaxID=3160832 RepID=UPI00386368FE
MKTLLHFFCLILLQQATAQQFQYLGEYDGLGVPDYLEPVDDYVSTESMAMIDAALPESYPVPDYNPQYISAGYDTNIELAEDAAVWVTFVKEGAGYKNVLGFYTYDIEDRDRSKPTDRDITIIFPNASKEWSGGGLREGNKVKLGDFKAGTGIGWVLLANAWNGNNVGWGLWQVYSDPQFNPEERKELRHHAVLLADPENERIYLGFEDIRRDYGSCDQDFNDAIFYVSANPYTAIKTENVADVKMATDVSSANKGGLESNGKLAALIAERNFDRLKSSYNKFQKTSQQKFHQKYSVQKNAEGIDLSSLIPETGMFGTEQARISSPDDLMGITNASAVFSADYYQGEKRVAAALMTSTSNGIYDHSKVICDRLNSSSLEDIRTIELKGHELIMIKILRASGQLEYAVNFSVKLNEALKLHSHWNISDYPDGDYLNFQVWGSNMGQVSSIAGHVIDKINAFQTLESDKIVGKYPTVFVKRGFYKDSRLHLIVKNKEGDSGFTIDGKIRDTETTSEKNYNKTVSLDKSYEEEIIVETGELFDIGMQIRGQNSPQADDLYLADGPWGIDYLETETQVEEFSIQNSDYTAGAGEYHVERNVNVSGNVMGTANIFRSLMPGDQDFEIAGFEGINFEMQNDLEIEMILVTSDLQDWNERYRLKLDSKEEITAQSIALNDFSNSSGNYKGEDLKAIVFSVQGDYSYYQDFAINIKNLVFSASVTVNEPEPLPEPVIDIAELDSLVQKKAYNYPNPFKTETSVVLPMEAATAEIYIYDLTGKIIYSKIHNDVQTKNELPVKLRAVNPGIYKGVLILNGRHKFTLSLLVTH